MEKKETVVFTAFFSDRTAMWFYSPQTWRNVFTTCKGICQDNAIGCRIYCDGTLVRKVGINRDFEKHKDEVDLHLEWIPRLSLYRVSHPRCPWETIAYVDTPEEGFRTAIDAGYVGAVVY